jgi:hypothetical protein
MYTGELVVGAGELGELRSLGRALGAAALLHQIACLEAQLAAAARPQHALFSLQHRSSGYTESCKTDERTGIWKSSSSQLNPEYLVNKRLICRMKFHHLGKL